MTDVVTNGRRLVRAMQTDDPVTTVEVVDHLGETGKPERVRAIGTGRCRRSEQLDEVVQAAGRRGLAGADADGEGPHEPVTVEQLQPVPTAFELEPVLQPGQSYVGLPDPPGAAVRSHRQLDLHPPRLSADNEQGQRGTKR